MVPVHHHGACDQFAAVQVSHGRLAGARRDMFEQGRPRGVAVDGAPGGPGVEVRVVVDQTPVRVFRVDVDQAEVAPAPVDQGPVAVAHVTAQGFFGPGEVRFGPHPQLRAPGAVQARPVHRREKPVRRPPGDARFADALCRGRFVHVAQGEAGAAERVRRLHPGAEVEVDRKAVMGKNVFPERALDEQGRRVAVGDQERAVLEGLPEHDGVIDRGEIAVDRVGVALLEGLRRQRPGKGVRPGADD